MAHGLTGIDHAVLAAADLEAARASYSRLGFTLSPRGRHVGWATGNYCIMFPGNYLELLGIAEPGGFSAGLEEAIASRGEGVHKIVPGTKDAAASRASLAAAGLKPGEPQSLKRALELPEGNVMPAFTLVHLPPEATPETSMFLCQHLTPALLRKPEWLLHPNGALQLSGFVVACADPPALEQSYERLFGAGNAVRTDRLLTVRCGEEYVLFATPDDITSLFPDLDHDPARALPYVAGMRFRVHNTEAPRAYFKARGIAHERSLDGRVFISQEDAHGCFLEFAAQN